MSKLLPTCVGVNLMQFWNEGHSISLPHACGGEPLDEAVRYMEHFLTFVGMNLVCRIAKCPLDNIPHVCGGKPMTARINGSNYAFLTRVGVNPAYIE